MTLFRLGFRLPSVRLFALLGLLVIVVSPLAAQDAKTAPPPPATTTAAPEIPVDHLDLLLDPLTKDELLVEAEAWRDLLKAKVSEISAQEIATREKTKEIARTSGTPATAAEPESQQNAEKDQHLEALKKSAPIDSSSAPDAKKRFKKIGVETAASGVIKCSKPLQSARLLSTRVT